MNLNEQKPSFSADRGINAKPIAPSHATIQKGRNGFKPLNLRTGTLSFLILINVVLLGLVEYACRTLPSVDRYGTFNKLVNRTSGIFQRDLRYDEEEISIQTISTIIGAHTKTIIVTHRQLELRQPLVRSTSSPSMAVSSTPRATVFLDTHINSSPSSKKPSSVRLSTVARSIYLNTKASPSSSSQLLSTPPPPPPPPPESVYLDTEISSTRRILTTVSTSKLSASKTPTPLSSPPPLAHFNTEISSSQKVSSTLITVGHPPPPIYLNTETSSPRSVSTTPSTSDNPTNPTPPANQNSDSCTTIPCPPDPTAAEQEYFMVDGPKRYFLGAYAPTLLAIILSFPITIIALSTRAMEPFYQLGRPAGASGGATLLLNYHSITGIIKAVLYGHWAVVITTILSFLGVILTPLAPVAMFIRLIGHCNATTTSCTGSLGIYLPAARAIEAILCLMVVLLILLLFVLHGRWTGVYSDPRSMAGLAAIFRNTGVRNEFRTVTSENDLRVALEKTKYQLDDFVYEDGVAGYGIVQKDGQGQHSYTYPSSQQGYNSGLPVTYSPYGYQPVTTQYVFASQPHPYEPGPPALPLHRKAMYRLPVLVLSFILLSVLIVLFVYHYTSGDNPFERFMDSQGFGVRFLFTCIGVGIKLYWEWIYESVALMAPYHHLTTLSDAYPLPSLLLPTVPYPLTSIWPFLRIGNLTLLLIAFTTLLSVPLTLTLSTIPFSNATVWMAYILAHWLSVAILVFMLLTLLLLCFYKEPGLPIKPNIMGAHMYYLFRGGIGEGWKEVGHLSTDERNKVLRAMSRGSIMPLAGSRA